MARKPKSTKQSNLEKEARAMHKIVQKVERGLATATSLHETEKIQQLVAKGYEKYNGILTEIQKLEDAR